MSRVKDFSARSTTVKQEPVQDKKRKREQAMELSEEFASDTPDLSGSSEEELTGAQMVELFVGECQAWINLYGPDLAEKIIKKQLADQAKSNAKKLAK